MSDVSEILPPDDTAPVVAEIGVARDIQRDALALARSDAWLNIAIAVGLVATTVFVAFGMFIVAGRGIPRERNYSLVIQFAIIDVVTIINAIHSWRRFRRLREAVETDTIAIDPADAIAMQSSSRRFMVLGSRPIVLLMVLAALGLQWRTSRLATTGPIVFRNATIMTSTGFLQDHMTIAIADGRIVFVGAAGDEEPRSVSGARRIDALEAQVSAATFDHSVAAPLDGLRHIWAGQLFEGAPGDVVITPVPVRGRGGRGGRGGGGGGGFGGGAPREILGAVVSGRYYTASQMQKK